MARFHFILVSKKVNFKWTYLTNSQSLAIDYQSFSMVRMRRCAIKILASICCFNIYRSATMLRSRIFTYRSESEIFFLLSSWVKLRLGWNLLKLSRDPFSFSWPWVLMKKMHTYGCKNLVPIAVSEFSCLTSPLNSK